MINTQGSKKRAGITPNEVSNRTTRYTNYLSAGILLNH
jgi:hypothetical protein